MQKIEKNSKWKKNIWKERRRLLNKVTSLGEVGYFCGILRRHVLLYIEFS